MFIYPGNLKEKKTFAHLTIFDFAIVGSLSVIFVVYSVENYSFLPLSVPIMYLIFKIRLLENSTNLWDLVLVAFNYLVDCQQTYYWGERKDDK